MSDEGGREGREGEVLSVALRVLLHWDHHLQITTHSGTRAAGSS